MKDFFTVRPEDTAVIALYIFFVVFALSIGIIGFMIKLYEKKDKESK
ncbi:MAG TPA: hypothetical protein PLT50_01380 [bacterium]|nr:hypothetical protein [bacterium]